MSAPCVRPASFAAAQTFALAPSSASLATIPAGSSELLVPAAPPAAGAPAPPVVGLSAEALGLLPGDVIDAVSLGNDGGLGGSTVYFTVSRASTGLPTGFAPEVATESTRHLRQLPGGRQPVAGGRRLRRHRRRL